MKKPTSSFPLAEAYLCCEQDCGFVGNDSAHCVKCGSSEGLLGLAGILNRAEHVPQRVVVVNRGRRRALALPGQAVLAFAEWRGRR